LIKNKQKFTKISQHRPMKEFQTFFNALKKKLEIFLPSKIKMSNTFYYSQVGCFKGKKLLLSRTSLANLT